MLIKRHLLFVLCLLMLGVAPLTAQDSDQDSDKKEKKEKVKKEKKEKVKEQSDEYPYPAATSEDYKDFVIAKDQDQQDKFLDHKYNFPGKPKDKWELGLNLGALWISGDIHNNFPALSASGNFQPRIGIGGHIRRSLGYVVSLRGSFMAGSTWGRNWQGAQGWARSSVDENFIPNKSLAGEVDPSSRADLYRDLNNEFNKVPDYTESSPVFNNYVVFYNYKTNIRELNLSAVFNLHNIRFHKRETGMNVYGVAGLGGTAYRTYMDMLDANGNEYDFGTITSAGFYGDRKATLEALDRLYDGTFESQAERHFDDYSPFDNYSYKPTAHTAIGVAYKVNRKFNLALESKVTYTNDDLLDGQRWQEWGALTRDYDTYVYTSLNANFNLGPQNSVEPLWWMNPLDYAYEELAEAPCCDDLPPFPDLDDDDNDGVPNAWDEEPDSDEGCPVDTKGIMLDSDKDGLLDCNDACPYTPAARIKDVDAKGCAPKLKITCDDIDNLCACVKSCAPPPPPRTTIITDPCASYRALPQILFDLNKYGVNSQFLPQLAEVANQIKNSGQSFCVIGHTDARSNNSYNDVLSYKRAQEVMNVLSSQYGVPMSQLVLQYSGETAPAIGGLDAGPGVKGIDADHALNRRVEFRCGCNGQINMGRPSGPDAGRRAPEPRP
ncbi:MAG: OmpA family protein [Chitinophagales bacterium]